MSVKKVVVGLVAILVIAATIGLLVINQDSGDSDVDTSPVEEFFDAINDGDAEAALEQIHTDSRYMLLDIASFYDTGFSVGVDNVDAESMGRGSATVSVTFTDDSDPTFSSSQTLRLDYDYADQRWKIDPQSFLPILHLDPDFAQVTINDHQVDITEAQKRPYQYLLPGSYTIEADSASQWVEIVDSTHEVTLGLNDRAYLESDVRYSEAAYEQAQALVEEYVAECLEIGYTIGPQCRLIMAGPRDPGYENLRYEVVNDPVLSYDVSESFDPRFLSGHIVLDGGSYNVTYDVNGESRSQSFTDVFNETMVQFTIQDDQIVLTPEYLGGS